MPTLVTMQFSAKSDRRFYNIGESHYLVNVGELAHAYKPAAELCRKRMAIMGLGVEFFGCRISLDGINGDSRFIVPNENIDGARFPAIAALGKDEDWDVLDPPNSCLNVRMEAGDRRRKTLYLAGIPDRMIRSQPTGRATDLVPGWLKAFNAWRDFMASGIWGAKFRALAAENPVALPKPILDYVRQAGGPSRLGVVTALGAVNVNAGDHVQIRGARQFQKVKPVPNGRWIVHSRVDAADKSTYYLRGSELVDDQNIEILGTFEGVAYVPAAYQEGRITIVEQTTRKRGGSVAAGRGK